MFISEGTDTVTESNHLPETGVYVPFAKNVFDVSVGTAATVTSPVVHFHFATAVCSVAVGVIVAAACFGRLVTSFNIFVKVVEISFG